MAVKVQQVLEILEQIAPPELACSWDNVGLLVDAGRPVTSIMTALDITADVVRDAARASLTRCAARRRRMSPRCCFRTAFRPSACTPIWMPLPAV